MVQELELILNQETTQHQAHSQLTEMTVVVSDKILEVAIPIQADSVQEEAEDLVVEATQAEQDPAVAVVVSEDKI